MDRDSFIAEIEACSGMMYRVAWSILRNNADCEDALQEAALKAWEKRGHLRNEAYFRTWMIPLDEVAERAAAASPDPALTLALEALPEKLRLPLVLCYSEGMSYEEAAAALRIPLSTLRGRIHRGRGQLRKELNAE